MAQVVSLNISEKKGQIKLPVPTAQFQVDSGIAGDAHAGNWHRQVSLLAQESIDKMTAMGVKDLSGGKFAENITTQGIELFTLPIGTLLQVGEVQLRVTQIGKHCHQHCDIFHQIGSCIMPTEGIFATVEKSGIINVGDPLEVLPA